MIILYIHKNYYKLYHFILYPIWAAIQIRYETIRTRTFRKEIQKSILDPNSY